MTISGKSVATHGDNDDEDEHNATADLSLVAWQDTSYAFYDLTYILQFVV